MLNTLLAVWFVLTAVSTAYVSYDLLRRTPAMGVMKLGWTLVVFVTGPIGLALYLASCRKPTGQSHQSFIVPRWKQAIGSTIHCLAGDATAIVVAAAITTAMGFAMAADLVVEYAAGFTFGLLIFQALFRKTIRGGSYLAAVRATILPEWLSMNALMAGMIPVMVILMSLDTRAMEPTSVRFWGVMSLATIVGGALAYPVNWWLVATGLKGGMGSSHALGRGGHDPATELPSATASGRARAVATAIALLMLFVGLALAIGLGDLSMRPPR